MKLTPLRREFLKVFWYNIGVQDMLRLWLCTHQSDILFPAKHSVAYDDQLTQQRFVFSPLNFPTLLVAAEHEVHS
jgi:hypothetical protein